MVLLVVSEVVPLEPRSAVPKCCAAVYSACQAYNAASGQVLWSRESPGAPDALSAQLLGGLDDGAVWAAALLPS